MSRSAAWHGPFHGLIGASLHTLERTIETFASLAQRSDADDVAAVRAMAEGMRSSDPSQALELLALAARHESSRDHAADCA